MTLSDLISYLFDRPATRELALELAYVYEVRGTHLTPVATGR
jgi:hypothetical protein